MGDEKKDHSILTRIKLWISKTSEKKPVRYFYSFAVGVGFAGGIIGACTIASVAIIPAAVLAAIAGVLAGYFANKGINHLIATRDKNELIPLLEKKIGDMEITFENERRENALAREREKKKETTYNEIFNIFAKHLKDDTQRKEVADRLHAINSDHSEDDSEDIFFETNDVKIDLPSDMPPSTSKFDWDKFGAQRFSVRTAQTDSKEDIAPSQPKSKPRVPLLRVNTDFFNNTANTEETIETTRDDAPLLLKQH
jgi:hypothetical protein